MAKKDLFKKSLTSQEFKILTQVVKDPYLFATFAKIVHPLKGAIPFDLFSYQKKVLYYFMRYRFNIILKFRQAGLTELIALYALWLTMFHPYKNVQIISIKDKVAKKVLSRIKFTYKHLPEFLRMPIINGRPGEFGTVTEMQFANGSSISSVPTTEDAGRSEAVSLLVVDEAAIVRYANQIWAAAFPTLSTGGSAILNSTPFGVGNFYHKSWVDSLTPNSVFHPIRLKWQMHPDRDIKWYNEMASALGPRRTAQEVDGSFLSSGFSVFDLADIKQIEDLMSDYEVLETRYNGGLRIIERPKSNKKYFIGADIATGRAKDYSAFSIMTRGGEEVAYFKGRVPIEKFVNILFEYGKLYNNAVLAPEANDVGIAVVIGLQNLNYPNLYFTETLVKEKGKSKRVKKKVPGWLTTGANRSVIINELEQDIRNEFITVKDPFFAEEAYTFIYDNQNRPVAMGKGNTKDSEESDLTYTDDAIMAKAITNFIRKGSMNTSIVIPV